MGAIAAPPFFDAEFVRLFGDLDHRAAVLLRPHAVAGGHCRRRFAERAEVHSAQLEAALGEFLGDGLGPRRR